MTSAAIAQADLTERKAHVTVKVVKVLKKHLHFESKWADNLSQVPADDGGLYLFMLAARWSDDVRKKFPE